MFFCSVLISYVMAMSAACLLSSGKSPAVQGLGSIRDDAKRQIARAEHARVEEWLSRGAEPRAPQRRHGGKAARQRMRAGGKPDGAVRKPQGKIPTSPVHGTREHWHLGPDGVGGSAPDWPGTARGHIPRGMGPRRAGARWRSDAGFPGEGKRERPAVAQDPVRSPRRQVEQRSGREVPRHPATADHALVEVWRRAPRYRGPRRDRTPSLELEPHAVHVTVVVKPHALAAAAVDEEEERAFLAAGTEERGAQLGHETCHAWQDLVDLRHVDGGALVERTPDLSPSGPPDVASIGGDLHGEAREGEVESLAETRRDGAPGGSVRGNEPGPASTWRPRNASRRSRRGSRGTQQRCGRP